MVSVITVSASQAVESGVVTVPRVHVSAVVAFLARVSRVNHHGHNTVLCGLIRRELLQLGERPLVEHIAAHSAGLGTFSCLTADVRQVLERYDADVRSVRQLFRRAMVSVADEPLFPMSHCLQPAVGASGAFFLQRFPIVCVTAFHSLHVRVGDFTSSRIHEERVLPQVHAQHVTLFDERGLWQSVDEHDARTATVRVQHEFRCIQAAFGISAVEPVRDIGQ